MSLFRKILIFLGLAERKIVKAEYDKISQTLSIEYDDGCIVKFEGSGTVWRKYPMMNRASSIEEGVLSDIWNYIRYHGNSYPTAHKN